MRRGQPYTAASGNTEGSHRWLPTKHKGAADDGCCPGEGGQERPLTETQKAAKDGCRRNTKGRLKTAADRAKAAKNGR